MTAREMLERMAGAAYPEGKYEHFDESSKVQLRDVIQAALRELVEQCEQDNIPHLTIGARIAYSVLAITELEL